MLNKQFKKNERIVSQKQIDELFAGVGSHTRAAFPLRVVYLINDRASEQPAAQLLISVPKRRLHHAVDRNRVKRQLREAYRNNKHMLLSAVPQGKTVSLAFIWLAERHFDTIEVEDRVKHIITHIVQKLSDIKE